MKNSFVLIVFVLLFVGCSRQNNFPQQLTIPKNGFALESNIFQKNPNNKILFYMKFMGCPSCKISEFQEIEEELFNSSNDKTWETIYIVETDSLHKFTAYSMMCNARLRGHIYIDTSGCFLKSNAEYSKYFGNKAFILDSLNNVKELVEYSKIKGYGLISNDN